jgi:hypothetical protein
MTKASDLQRFYQLLDRLAVNNDGPRILGIPEGSVVWPTRGVYFFLEKGEFRSGSGAGSRVVRVGTHGLKAGSSCTLWGRLTHRAGRLMAGDVPLTDFFKFGIHRRDGIAKQVAAVQALAPQPGYGPVVAGNDRARRVLPP